MTSLFPWYPATSLKPRGNECFCQIHFWLFTVSPAAEYVGTQEKTSVTSGEPRVRSEARTPGQCLLSKSEAQLLSTSDSQHCELSQFLASNTYSREYPRLAFFWEAVELLLNATEGECLVATHQQILVNDLLAAPPSRERQAESSSSCLTQL